MLRISKNKTGWIKKEKMKKEEMETERMFYNSIEEKRNIKIEKINKKDI